MRKIDPYLKALYYLLFRQERSLFQRQIRQGRGTPSNRICHMLHDVRPDFRVPGR